MNRTLKYYRIMFFRHDLAAGLAVFFVALPLCLGIALASGAPLYAGLISGMVGGLVVGALSGSSLAVTGPAAGLSTVVAASIISLGDYRIFLLSVLIAGAFQIILGVLKLGAIANYFPSSVIKGMLAAIGLILIMKQIPLALGYEKSDFWTSGLSDLFKKDTWSTKDGIPFTAGSTMIAVVSVFIMLFHGRYMPKKFKMLPASLMVVLCGVLMNTLFTYSGSSLALDKAQLVQIPSNIFSEMAFPDFTKLFTNSQIWKDGLILGLLATLETLLCIEAIDKLDKHNRITPVNRELMAQGSGNMVCGLLGAIPMTAVVVRGAANVQAGAKTKLSAITHGLLLLLAVLLIPFLLNTIPYASLAAILLVTGYNLTKPKLYKELYQLGWKQFLPFILTVIIILSTDLLVGVSIGLLLSIYFIIQNNFTAEYKIIKTTRNGIDSELIKLNSNVTFLNKVKLKKALDEVPEYSVLTIDGSESRFIDYDVLEMISEFETKARDRHIELHCIGIEKVNVTALH